MSTHRIYDAECVSEFLSFKFDYVIVGGGTAGSVIAARLTEQPDIHVAVIEAGKSRMGDPYVDSPAGLSNTLHNPQYDWMYQSTPQTGTNGRIHHVARGKLLGGSSGINYMAYCKPAKEDIDSWGKLGLKGWSWNELQHYYLKSQTIDAESGKKAQTKPDFYSSLTQSHGHSGPILTAFPPSRAHFEDLMIDALDDCSGIPRTKDPWSGTIIGQYGHLSTVDRSNCVSRSYAASAYLYPHIHRPNLKVLTEAEVCKILLDESHSAQGVEFTCGGNTYQISVSSEVILAAGSVQSPRLLELSGIGDPEVLHAAGVECVVSIPGVGNNLQDHPMTSLTYAIPKSPLDDRVSDSGVSVVAFLPYSKLVSETELAETISQVQKCWHISEVERQLVTARLQDGSVPSLQFNGTSSYLDIGGGYDNQGKLLLDTTGHETNYYSYHVTMSRPLSRGSCHITSPCPSVAPSVDLGLLTERTDVDILVAGLNFIDRVFTSSHVSHRVAGRVVPSPDVDLKDQQQSHNFVREWTTSFNHLIGTCAMGLVVNERLLVKGVGGLRVVDASIMPTQISGNIMATVYAVAERAADLIKEDHHII